MEPQLAPMTSAIVVCRAVPGANDVEHFISDFLDASRLWTIPSACERRIPGSVRLLARVAALEDPGIDPLLKRNFFTRGLEKAVKRGDFEVVRWIVENYLPEGRIRSPVITAVKHDRLEILKWLRENHDERVVWDPSAMFIACSGNLEVVKWVHENLAPIDRLTKKRLMEKAVPKGDVDMVEWLSSNDLLLVQPLSLAIKADNIAMIEWIRGHSQVQFEAEMLEAAIRNGSIMAAKWLYSNYGFSDVHAVAVVEGIENMSVTDIGNIDDSFTWMLENLDISSKVQLSRAIDSLSRLGSLRLIKKIHGISVGGLCSPSAMDKAAESGQLDLVKWFHTNRSEGCTTRAMDKAAELGHLDVVRWLHMNRTEGCTTDAMDGAAANGHLDTLMWLHENRSEGCTTDAMDYAAANGHLEILEWLHKNSNGGCTPSAMDNAAENGHLDVVEWLLENRSEGRAPTAIFYATGKGHFKVVERLSKDLGYVNSSFAEHHTHASYLPMLQCINRTFEGIPGVTRETFAESAVCMLISSHVDVDFHRLLHHIPDNQYSVVPILCATRANKLEIALALAQDGRFACNGICLKEACLSGHAEIFQWLVRDFSISIPEMNGIIEQQTASNLFFQDALEELELITGWL